LNLGLAETSSRILVETVRIACVGVLPFGDTGFRENEHVELDGSPEQTNAIGCVGVPIEVNSRGKRAVWPAEIELLETEGAMRKSFCCPTDVPVFTKNFIEFEDSVKVVTATDEKPGLKEDGSCTTIVSGFHD
jgi:hypothetical protein